MRLRGDPDDLGTAALAEFLAPAVIISADSVFTPGSGWPTPWPTPGCR